MGRFGSREVTPSAKFKMSLSPSDLPIYHTILTPFDYPGKMPKMCILQRVEYEQIHLVHYPGTLETMTHQAMYLNSVDDASK